MLHARAGVRKGATDFTCSRHELVSDEEDHPMPKAVGTLPRFTYADYLTWPDDERWEIIGGEAHAMTPAPSPIHQRLVLRVASRLESALRGHPCEAFVAPVDVVLSESDVVQPDVIVVCDRTKIARRGIEGAPDVVVEVLSPGSGLRDRREKRALYERSGVKEYLLVDGDGRLVERFRQGADGAYGKPDVFGPEETMRLESLGDLELPLSEILEPDVFPTPDAVGKTPQAEKA